MPNEVAQTCATYDRMAESWKLPRALMGGTKAMRKAGETYLPKEPGESAEAYESRCSRSTLFNAFKRTVGGMTGKVFARDIAIGDDVPDAIAGKPIDANAKKKERKDGWVEDIDLTGRNINSFARDVFHDGVQTGISHILVDMPAGEPARTVAEEQAAGRRPYLVHIKAEDMIGWRTETIKGREVLTQIRFREHITTDDGEYGEKSEERIRVLWRDRYEVWRKIEKAGPDGELWEMIEKGAVSLGEIPLATFYAARTGFMTAEPPLEDLAYLNASHWQSASDQRHILHVARVPILFGRGLNLIDENGQPVQIGSNRMITSNDEHGDLKYVEHNGAGISAGRQDLIDIEDRMRVMGLELFMPKTTGTQTATGKAIDSAEQNSVVKTTALSLKDAMEQALVYMAKWAKLGDSGGSLVVNTDYLTFTGQAAQDITALLNARMAGEISRTTFWSEMKRRGFLADDFEVETEEERLAEEAPGLAGVGMSDDDENAEDGEAEAA